MAPNDANSSPSSRPPTRRARRPRSQAIEIVLTLIAAIVVLVLVQSFLVKPFRIPSTSMVPTLIRGQRILVNRLDRHPKLGDVVVFHPSTGARENGPAICGNSWQGMGMKQACDKPVPVESSQTYVKRVVGLGGDHLRIIDGYVYRNGQQETGSYIQQCMSAGAASCDFPQTIVVPVGYYYMMGDNRSVSDDSRFWGPVPQRWIIGVAFFNYWPPDRFGTL